MMALGSRWIVRSHALAALRHRLALALLLCAFAPSTWAQGEDAADTVLAQATVPAARERQPQMEVSATSLPRFDNTDGATRSARIDMSWFPPRPSALGLSVGMTGTDAIGLSAAQPFTGASPQVGLGLHWRHTLDNSNRIDITAWRRVGPTDAASLIQSREPSYGARVEMRIASGSKRGLVADRGFLGLQLESGARITLRKSRGGMPTMMYYRTKF
jgi:hypothetical protein